LQTRDYRSRQKRRGGDLSPLFGENMTEIPTVRVFNNAPAPKSWLVESGWVELKPGEWTPVREDVVIRELLNDRKLIFDWGGNGPTGISRLPLPYLTIATQIDIVTGYGNMACHLIPPLAERFEVQLHPLMYWRREGTPGDIVSLMDKTRVGYTDWALAMCIPPELKTVPCPNIVLLSMWETGALPDKWADEVNKYAKHLVVPCEDQKEVFRSSGVEVPTTVVPLGVNTSVYSYKERPQRTDEPFTILLYGALSSRKSPIETVMNVCWKAFKDVDDWLLILKTRYGMVGGGKFRPRIKDTHVQIISTDYHPHEMRKLCYQADCGIFLSKYEGFGLPPREMMATGLPVIWTAAHGHLEDCYKGVTIDVPVKGPVPAGEAYAGLGGWVMPNWDAAAMALRAEYDDWKARGKTQSPMGTRAAEYIVANRTWNHTVTSLISTIKAVGM
jgi:glycosyltransferase involved in cell wall biosynthesis